MVERLKGLGVSDLSEFYEFTILVVYASTYGDSMALLCNIMFLGVFVPFLGTLI